MGVGYVSFTLWLVVLVAFPGVAGAEFHQRDAAPRGTGAIGVRELPRSITHLPDDYGQLRRHTVRVLEGVKALWSGVARSPDFAGAKGLQHGPVARNPLAWAADGSTKEHGAVADWLAHPERWHLQGKFRTHTDARGVMEPPTHIVSAYSLEDAARRSNKDPLISITLRGFQRMIASQAMMALADATTKTWPEELAFFLPKRVPRDLQTIRGDLRQKGIGTEQLTAAARGLQVSLGALGAHEMLHGIDGLHLKGGLPNLDGVHFVDEDGIPKSELIQRQAALLGIENAGFGMHHEVIKAAAMSSSDQQVLREAEAVQVVYEALAKHYDLHATGDSFGLLGVPSNYMQPKHEFELVLHDRHRESKPVFPLQWLLGAGSEGRAGFDALLRPHLEVQELPDAFMRNHFDEAPSAVANWYKEVFAWRWMAPQAVVTAAHHLAPSRGASPESKRLVIKMLNRIFEKDVDGDNAIYFLANHWTYYAPDGLDADNSVPQALLGMLQGLPGDLKPSVSAGVWSGLGEVVNDGS